MNLERLNLADTHIADINRAEMAHSDLDKNAPPMREVLEELFELLEDYAPAWYTERHHNRAVAALLGRRV